MAILKEVTKKRLGSAPKPRQQQHAQVKKAQGKNGRHEETESSNDVDVEGDEEFEEDLSESSEDDEFEDEMVDVEFGEGDSGDELDEIEEEYDDEDEDDENAEVTVADRSNKGDKKKPAPAAAAPAGNNQKQKGKGAVPEVKTETPKKRRMNKVLLLASRGIIQRHRHLLKDFHKLLPHCRKENKLDSKSKLFLLNEIADMHNCNYTVYLENRKREDLYLWFSKVPEGPSMKFYVQNVHNMDELKMTGNCLKGSRPLLSFDAQFNEQPHYQLMKEMFIQIFNTPKGHPKSKPFFDHVFSFTIADEKIWFRNYQITETVNDDGQKQTTLVEIGPRFVLSLMRIFGGSFGGPTLYQNMDFISPNEVRREMRKQEALKQLQRKQESKEKATRRAGIQAPVDELDTMFD